MQTPSQKKPDLGTPVSSVDYSSLKRRVAELVIKYGKDDTSRDASVRFMFLTHLRNIMSNTNNSKNPDPVRQAVKNTLAMVSSDQQASDQAASVSAESIEKTVRSDAEINKLLDDIKAFYLYAGFSAIKATAGIVAAFGGPSPSPQGSNASGVSLFHTAKPQVNVTRPLIMGKRNAALPVSNSSKTSSSSSSSSAGVSSSSSSSSSSSTAYSNNYALLSKMEEFITKNNVNEHHSYGSHKVVIFDIGKISLLEEYNAVHALCELPGRNVDTSEKEVVLNTKYAYYIGGNISKEDSGVKAAIIIVDSKDEDSIKLMEALLKQFRNYPVKQIHIKFTGCDDTSLNSKIQERAEQVLKSVKGHSIYVTYEFFKDNESYSDENIKRLFTDVARGVEDRVVFSLDSINIIRKQ